MRITPFILAVLFLVLSLTLFVFWLTGAEGAEELAVSGVAEDKENWHFSFAYRSPDLKFSWFRKMNDGTLDYGYDYSLSRKVSFVEAQIRAFHKQLKRINMQELSLMGNVKGVGLGVAISTINLKDSKLLLKAKYSLEWRWVSLSAEWASNLKNRRQYSLDPRIKLPQWRNWRLGISGRYQRLNEKEFKRIKAEVIAEIGG